jgi:hypothetical protein
MICPLKGSSLLGAWNSGGPCNWFGEPNWRPSLDPVSFGQQLGRRSGAFHPKANAVGKTLGSRSWRTSGQSPAKNVTHALSLPASRSSWKIGWLPRGLRQGQHLINGFLIGDEPSLEQLSARCRHFQHAPFELPPNGYIRVVTQALDMSMVNEKNIFCSCASAVRRNGGHAWRSQTRQIG